MSINGCELVNRTRELAKHKGLPPSGVVCFYGQLGQCMGTTCTMIEPKENPSGGEIQLARFYTRLAKHMSMSNRQTPDSVSSIFLAQ